MAHLLWAHTHACIAIGAMGESSSVQLYSSHWGKWVQLCCSVASMRILKATDTGNDCVASHLPCWVNQGIKWNDKGLEDVSVRDKWGVEVGDVVLVGDTRSLRWAFQLACCSVPLCSSCWKAKQPKKNIGSSSYISKTVSSSVIRQSNTCKKAEKLWNCNHIFPI